MTIKYDYAHVKNCFFRFYKFCRNNFKLVLNTSLNSQKRKKRTQLYGAKKYMYCFAPATCLTINTRK